MKTFREIAEGKIPAKNKNGDCYVVSYNYMMNNQGAKLVHGLVDGQGALQGMTYNHSWVEEGNMIVDMTLPKEVQKTLPKEVYYALGNIKTTFEYSFEELLGKAQEYETYGPWEKVLLKNKY